MKAKNIQQLIEILQQYPPDSKWYGFDDGSINLIVPQQNNYITIETDFYDRNEECAQSQS